MSGGPTRQQDWASAQVHLEKALGLLQGRPGDEAQRKHKAGLHSRLASVHLQLQNFEPALEQAKLALELEKDLGKAWLYRGSALLKLGRAADAVAALERAEALAPSDAVTKQLGKARAKAAKKTKTKKKKTEQKKAAKDGPDKILRAAAAAGDHVCVRTILEQHPEMVDAANSRGHTALMRAANSTKKPDVSNHGTVVEFLLTRKAQVNAQDNEGNTAL